jgi:predicted Ser/Thr protein kinase
MIDRIGHYKIVAELGRGGMGIVYKAHEESLNRYVAIKVLGEHLTEDPAHVERFLREARSAASLNHPNIVQIYAVSEDGGRHFFAMEYVAGRSLQQILRSSGPLDPIQVARIAIQTASGLRAAHDQGIIHRDVKPANLLIDERGLVKIADFGLALASGGVSRLTATGMFMGTPGYLSPEQCLDQNPDHRTDIYSLGVTLYEALCGKAPFTADSPLALLRQIVEVDPPNLGELKPDLDPALRSIVTRMMAKDREHRTSSCAELIGDLQAFLESKGASGSLVERVAAGAASPASRESADAANHELDLLPTEKVPSDAIAAGVKPVTLPAVETEAPVLETSAAEEPTNGSDNRLASMAVLIVLFGFVVIVGAGFIAWRSGVFQSDAGPLEASVAADPGSPTFTERAVIPAEPAGETEEPSLAAGGSDDEYTGTTVARPAASADPIADASSEREVLTEEPKARQTTASDRPRNEQVQDPLPPPPVQPPPEGTVVIAVGEPVLAGEAETVIESALARAGIPLVDEHGVPGFADLIGLGAAPGPEDVRRLLGQFAAHLILIRVEHLGERPLVYMGQRDVAYQARLVVVPIDVQDGAVLAQPVRIRTEYTHLNAQRVAEQELRRPAYRLSQMLAARQ